ncbi:MAG TPA: methylamine dehydrogenase accessory protein MauD, partial [Hyphomicrobium sp.]|nr:methylamine dehydrogenase accessory protein MauD [Hyphomicrobium sp.]
MAIEFLIASNVLLWLTVIAGAVVLLGITRQVGILHERSAPLGAMITDHGPDIGDVAPTFEVVDYFGKPLRIG